MEKQKTKMDPLTKVKTIFTVEYEAIAAILLTVGILKITGVMGTRQPRLLIYNIITIAGGLFLLYTMIRALLDKKYREKIELLDKALLAPIPLYLIPFDIYCFCHYENYNETFVKFSVAIILLYIGLVYAFLGIYHFHKPSKEILEALKEDDEPLKSEEEIKKDDK